MSACSVYVIGPQDGFYKIGVSRQPKTRLSQIRRREGPRSAILAVYERSTESEARGIERAAHRTLKARRMGGEWFDVAPEQAVEAIEAAILATENGEYANRRRTWGVKKMPTRTIFLIRRASQMEGVTIAQWLERWVLAWEKHTLAAPVAPPTAQAAPD